MRAVIALHASPCRQTVIPYAGNAVLHLRPDAGSVLICALYGLGEYQDMAFCLHVLRAGDLFCDVGANAGVYTILAARVAGARAIAIEPVPHTFDLLMQNIHANSVNETVDARRIAAGRNADQVQFTASLGSFNHVVFANESDLVTVEVQSLDNILAGRKPAVLKIDVEGFEGEVIAGASNTLQDESLKAIVIELGDGHLKRYGARERELTEALFTAGFKGPFWYDPARRKLEAPGVPRERRYNKIFIRDPNAITAIVADAPAFKINDSTI